MGSITDPPDGKAVAGSVFTAVGVYGVSIPWCREDSRLQGKRELIVCGAIGLPYLLRTAGVLTCEGESERADFAELGKWVWFDGEKATGVGSIFHGKSCLRGLTL